jgi:uncharacterized protein (TIGR02145 family)
MNFSALISALMLVASSAMAAAQGTLVDKRDGKKYKTVEIGSQTWMAENLNYKTADSYCYEDNSSNCTKYGRLYTWAAANTSCPEGWHLPSVDEFKTLFRSTGGIDVAGKNLKSKKGWNEENNGIDDFGFSALPAGSRGHKGEFYNKGNFASFWTSTEGGNNWAAYMNLGEGDYADLSGDKEGNGNSVRCLRD